MYAMKWDGIDDKTIIASVNSILRTHKVWPTQEFAPENAAGI